MSDKITCIDIVNTTNLKKVLNELYVLDDFIPNVILANPLWDNDKRLEFLNQPENEELKKELDDIYYEKHLNACHQKEPYFSKEDVLEWIDSYPQYENIINWDLFELYDDSI